jgi:hypothetical protein
MLVVRQDRLRDAGAQKDQVSWTAQKLGSLVGR